MFIFVVWGVLGSLSFEGTWAHVYLLETVCLLPHRTRNTLDLPSPGPGNEAPRFRIQGVFSG